MRHLSADQILLPNGQFASGMTLILDDQGVVVDVIPGSEPTSEHHHGRIIPGCINAHCHLELSHMKGMIPEGGGLSQFLKDIISNRKQAPVEEQAAATTWDTRMWEAGIQAVGDICNTQTTYPVKAVSRIRYHNLIEQFGLDPSKASIRYDQAVQLHAASKALGIPSSIVPHAPYSVSELLYDHIRNGFEPQTDIWSIHFLESASEQELIQSGTGPMKSMYVEMGIINETYQGEQLTATQKILKHIPTAGKILLVHNTYVTADDIKTLKDSGRFHDMWFCLCPSANLYIEGRLPNVPMMRDEGCQLVVGTDSLASNHQLSIAHEVHLLHQHFPEIPLAECWSWATLNGAKLYGWNDLGAFEKGRRPGVVLVNDGYATRLA